jgi:hypothetical protein
MEDDMSVYSGPYGQAPESGPRHRCSGFGWKPIELIAMILGFILFWPIGLAILFAKMWQMRSAYAGDLPSFVQAKLNEKFREKREKWEQKMGRHWACHGRHDFSGGPGNWRRSSGNLAFDEWREAELARLEEERQKLVAAEREFARNSTGSWLRAAASRLTQAARSSRTLNKRHRQERNDEAIQTSVDTGLLRFVRNDAAKRLGESVGYIFPGMSDLKKFNVFTLILKP